MFNLDTIVENLTNKIKPVLEEGKKQAEFSLLVNVATQLYCSSNLRGNTPIVEEAVEAAKKLIKKIRTIDNAK